jgi:CRISPR-associated protein Csx3
LRQLNLTGGKGLLFHGPMSLPIAMAFAHAVAHLYQFVACYDPKLAKYVVAISHTPTIRPGELLA